MATDDGSRDDWALEGLRASLRTSRSALLSDDFSISTERRIPDDPEKLQYFRELIAGILDGRPIAASYNLVLLGVLAVFSLLHLYQRWQERSKWRAIEQDEAATRKSPQKSTEDSVRDGEAESSSSSTLEGSVDSENNTKPTDVDIERQPLLGNRKPRHASKPSARTIPGVLRSWLMCQPQPIPLINRNLPCNGTSIFVLAWFCLNVFIHLYKLPLEPRYFFCFADRAGLVFVVNLPLLYLLAAKNQPLKLLTGRSYEALNIYHRRVGELMCFEAFLHFAGMLVWRIFITPDWLKGGDFWHFITHPLCLLGIGAFASYELLYFTSLGTFRERWYELFLASHVFLQIAGLAFLWLHFFTSRPYVCASLAIFFVDRLAWRMGLKSANFDADLTVLPDGRTLLLSADWDVPRQQVRKFPTPLRQSIVHGWYPADHVFVSVPALGRGHRLQAHPFTIASAAPHSVSPNVPSHAWLSLLIRVHSGFTSDLLQHALLKRTVRVRLDGPYGSRDPLNMLRACEHAVLIAGGSGIAVVFPLAWALAREHPRKRDVRLLWVIHSRSQNYWIPEERLAELRGAGVHVTIPRPTVEAGRPDIPAYVDDVAASSRGEIGVVVSGPDGLNRTARNACARVVRSGTNMKLRVEKFGW